MGYFMVLSPMTESQVHRKYGTAQLVQFSSRLSGNTVKIKMDYSEVFKSWFLEAEISICFSSFAF